MLARQHRTLSSVPSRAQLRRLAEEDRRRASSTPNPDRHHAGAGAQASGVDLLQLQRMVGNRAVTRLVEASSRPESGAAVLAVQREDGKGPEPKDETWGEWAYRHRWKIAGGALLGAVAAAGIYLYAQNSGDSADMKAPEGHPTPDDALKMAQDGLNHAPADAVVPQVESAVEQGAGGLSKLERMGLDITRDTLERVVEKLAGSQVASITAGTVKALNEGLDAAEAFELAHGGDNSVISSLA